MFNIFKGFNNPLKTGIIGSLVAALCCFTPILVFLLGALGLGWLTGYLDYVLFPVLFIFLGLTAYGYYRQKQSNPAPK
ncbi:MAG: mercury resistance system transport protein MerF [Chloroflexi bacterium]|nr:mercury resistance system transport protein MerF [Chloroflexota bacterium]